MAMIEQNISGVKLERMRQKVNRRVKIGKALRWGIFAAGEAATLGSALYGAGEVTAEWLLGVAAWAVGGTVLSFLVSFLFWLIYMGLFWAGPSNVFTQNYKNKYVLTKLREVPGFSGLKYTPDRGLPRGEICRDCLPPTQKLPCLRSEDYWEGSYEQVRFRSAYLEAWPDQSSLKMFDGQMMIFSLFDDYKISESPVQVFAKYGRGQEKSKTESLTFSNRIETENVAFNEKFSVYAADGHNAFYILTPRVLEDILAFGELVKSGLYIVFSGQKMYVGCEQADNPFEALADKTLDQHAKTITSAAEIIQKARDILIHLEQDRAKL